MMKTNRSSTRVERAGIRSNHALAQVSNLQTLIAKIPLDKLGHGPLKKQSPCFLIIADTLLNLLMGRRLANPNIATIRRTQSITKAADHIRHSAQPWDITRRDLPDLDLAAGVIIVKLNTPAIEKWNKKTIAGGSPLVAKRGQMEFLNHQRMQQPGQI